jgi:hypothetical protein
MQFNVNPLTKTNGDAFTNITSSDGTNVINTSTNQSTSIVASGVIDVVAPDAAVLASATDVTNGAPGILFTKAAHGLYTGLVGQFTTSNTLPKGLSLATNYYVIRVSATTFKVATTLANAIANTAVAYTNTGTGNQTFTPTALAGASITLQGSSDYDLVGANSARWVQVNSFTTTITADGTFNYELDYLRYPVYRLYVAVTSGMVNFTNLVIAGRN